MWFILLIFAFAIIMGLIIGSNEGKKTKARGETMMRALETIPDFTPTTKVIGPKNLFVFATDNNTQKVLLMRGSYKQFYAYEDIISVELIEDNNVVLKKSTGRTIGGAVIGGVLAGGVGAIVGGLSGSSKQQNLHSSVKVKVLLRNSSSPSLEISCFDCKTMTTEGKPVKDGSMQEYIYKQGLSNARRIVDILSVIIDAVDRSSSYTTPPASSTPSGSMADELSKLAVLKEKGILTDEEFVEQKAKLLKSETGIPAESKKFELPQSDPFEDEIRRMKAAGQKPNAIKLVVETLGYDFATAIDYVENLD